MDTKDLAYLLARATIGINLSAHGLVRFPKLADFKIWMVEYFKDSMIPSWAVEIWASVLPFVEFSLGVFILLGLFTKKVLPAGALVIIMLMFGSCMKENWEWVGIQMIYAQFFFFLMQFIKNNKYSFDSLIFKNK